MKTFKKILFPIDLSDVSEKIAPWVIMMAEKFNAQICLLFVARSFEYLHSFHLASPDIDDFAMSFTKGAEKKIEAFIEDNFKDYKDLKSEVVTGDPSDMILDYITAEDIDLVVMGTHGRKGLNLILFGSVAERVVKMSPVPVLTINPFRSSAD